MNSNKIPTKASKPSRKGKKPSKKSKASDKKLSVSFFEESLNMTDVSIEPHNETFAFQPNQGIFSQIIASDDEESEFEFIATSKSFIEEELTQDMEREIYETIKKRESKQMSIKE